MVRLPALFALLVMTLFGLVAVSPEAEARRLGGGGSFGGKSAFSTPYKRAAKPVRTPRQQQAAQQNQTVRQGYAQRGGLMGMLGGLAIGGLLGALFFGGAFENLNLLDILVFGGIAFMLFKLLGARAARSVPAADGGGYAGSGAPGGGAAAGGGSGFESSDWFRRGTARDATAPGSVPDAEFDARSDASALELPPDFDAEAFLAGARHAYRDLQQAWDQRDRDTLRALATPSMYRELDERLADLPDDNRTDVLKVEAELLEVIDLDDLFEATVLFDALLREERGERPQQVREVWHFTRPRDAARPTWFLDGIQQLED
ncbi:MAG: Tim44 domain-containing protein [Gammaproteobacteria bacterium]|nr:Tim44 domain-containing protein [Gammaproteobacteria bacterium]